MDRKEQNQYKKKLEDIRKVSEKEESDFQKLKEKNPKFIKEIKQVLEINGFHISLTTFEKPIIRGFERSEDAVQDGVEQRLENMELRKQLQLELDDFAERNRYISKDNSEALAELKQIKEKYKDNLTIREDNQRRTINKLKSIIQANFDEWTHFITLTHHHNELDIKRAKETIKEWTKKVRKLMPNFVYVYVMEFQERGSIHFHILCRCADEKGLLSKKDFVKVRETWKKGSINIRGIKYQYVPKKHVNEAMRDLVELGQDEQMRTIWSLGNYLTSYLQKGVDNMLLFGSQMYGNSKGLKPTIRITDQKKIAQILKSVGTDGLKENLYEIEIPETNNKLIKKYYNKLIKNQTE